MVRLNINIVRISDLNWTEMGEFHSDDHYSYHCAQVSFRRNGAALIVPLESPKFSTWTQPQKQQNDLISFPRKTINITVVQVYTPITDVNEAEVDCFYEYLQCLKLAPEKTFFSLECKSRKSGHTRNSRQVWHWSTKWSRAKEREVHQGNSLVIEDMLFEQPKK